MNVPSIGIEIELPWTTMLDRVDSEAATLLRNSTGFWNLPTVERARVQQGFDATDAQYRDIVSSVFGDRIKRGVDGYAEFALYPSYEHEALAATVQELYDLDILRAGEQCPLHITLGGLPPIGVTGLLLMAVELADGTTPARVTQKGTWEQKGLAGVMPRQAHELAFDMRTGVELRSLAATSPESVARAMAMAQKCGAILLKRLNNEPLATEVWRALYHLLTSAAAEKGLDASVKWQNPSQREIEWHKLADLLGDTVWREQTAHQAQEIVAA